MKPYTNKPQRTDYGRCSRREIIAGDKARKSAARQQASQQLKSEV